LSKAPKLVEAVADELYKCNRCGFCQTRCPIYRITGRESSVARGHLARLRAVVQGQIPFDDEIRTSLFECLMCRACTAECPPAIETDRTIAAARASYVGRRQSLLQRLIFRVVLPRPALLRSFVRVLAWLKRTRLTVFAGLLRLLPWVDRGYSEGPAMMPAPRTFLSERLARRRRVAEHGKRVIYFLGCAIDCAFPDSGEATLSLLEAAGFDVVVARNVCCGLPPYSYGDLESARLLARQNLEVFAEFPADIIVSDCASCSSFLKEYPRLFDGDDPMRTQAEGVAARVRDASEFLSSIELPGPLRSVEAVVTYHDPCHLSRYLGITEEPRSLLRRIPGLEFRELPEADWCCGGAGSYTLSHHDLSMQILERKMENIRATGAAIIATPCPACLMQLRYGAEKFDTPVQAIHLSEILQRALPSEEDGQTGSQGTP